MAPAAALVAPIPVVLIPLMVFSPVRKSCFPPLFHAVWPPLFQIALPAVSNAFGTTAGIGEIALLGPELTDGGFDAGEEPLPPHTGDELYAPAPTANLISCRVRSRS